MNGPVGVPHRVAPQARDRPPRSLSARLVRGMMGLILGIWCAAVLAAGLALRAELDEVFDGVLSETAEQLLPLVLAGGPGPEAVPGGKAGHGEAVLWQLRAIDGQVLRRCDEAPVAGFAAPLRPGFRTAGGYRVFTILAPDGRRALQVAQSASDRFEALGETLGAMLLPVLPVLAFGLWLSARLARQGLRPVLTLQAGIAARDPANLAPIDTRDLAPEIAAIARSVNRLLARLSAGLEAERDFAANSAHELRTPVAGALAQVQRLMADLPDGPQRHRAGTIAAALGRLARLVARLGELARAEAMAGEAAPPTDLLPVLDLVLAEFGTGGPRPRLLDPGATGRLIARIDPEGFAILIRNLIENARLHGHPDGPIDVVVDGSGLRVRNAGPVVPPDRLARLTGRFVRGETRARGSGLGLAIAAAIARQAGCALDLASPVPGQPDGFEARLRLATSNPAGPV